MTSTQIIDFSLRRVGGKLASSTANAHRRWDERHSLLLELRDEDGVYGRGEASPLPGFSDDSLDDCYTELHDILTSSLPKIDFQRPLLDQVDTWTNQLVHPAARFGLETALLDWASHRLHTPLHRILQPAGPYNSWTRCSLIGGKNPQAAIASARSSIQRGITTLKRKLSRDFERDLHILSALRKTLPKNIALRVDANQCWQTDIHQKLHQLSVFSLEFIEEPCPADHYDALSNSPIPICLDESLVGVTDLHKFAHLGWPQVLNLKPMLLGGMLRCLQLANQAFLLPCKVVVSHLFDGPIAFRAYEELATALSPSLACGLSPHAGLSAWQDPSTLSPNVHYTGPNR